MNHPSPRPRHLLSVISLSPGPGRRVASVGSASPTPDTSIHSRSSSRSNSNHIIVSRVNINSITSRCRLDELSYFSSLHDIDILGLSETKLNDTIHPSLYTLNLHDPLTKHRNRHGGGMAMYARSNISVKRLFHLEHDDYE